MSDRFVNLHNHSEYSFLDGYGTPKAFVERAKELDQRAIGITDHGNVSSHYKFSKEAERVGIKAILGCEMYIVQDLAVKDERFYNHITIWAKSQQGLENLYTLVSRSWLEGFYYKPRIDWSTLFKHKEGLIVTSGCPAGWLGKGLAANDFKMTEKLSDHWKAMKKNFKDDFYIEVSPWNYPEGKRLLTMLPGLAAAWKTKLVLTMDCHYPLVGQHEIQEVILCLQTKSTMDDPDRMKFDQQDFYLKDSKLIQKHWLEIDSVVADEHLIGTAMDSTLEIVDKCSVGIPKATSISFPLSPNTPEAKLSHLKKICKSELRKRKLDKNEEYVQRFEREIELIGQKGFQDYFLVIMELISWSRSQGIFVGCGRGSSAGSLVCFLTGIVQVDPLKYDLLFERFIDTNRSDLPDVDIDIEHTRRDEVKQHLVEKYGAENVATLATFTTFQSRMCFQDIGRVFKIPFEVIDRLKRYVVKRSGGDSRAEFVVADMLNNFEDVKKAFDQYPALHFASKLEGKIRGLSQHAAGVVVSNEPIRKFAAMYIPANNRENPIISMPYEDATAVGLLKIDLLGLSALTTIKICLAEIEKRNGVRIDPLEIDLEDMEVYTAFCSNNKNAAIFQFDGSACRQVVRQIVPENFDELVAINALSRPGALNSGGTSNYADIKFGRKQLEFVHPILEKYLGKTNGVVIYQEQVMKIVREVGGFTWDETGVIRKTISKSEGVEAFDRYKIKFLDGAKKIHGIAEKDAEKVWLNICTHGSWSFNKSHSVAYTMIGYWMMWLKVHHTMEFYWAMFKTEEKEETRQRVMKEFLRDHRESLVMFDLNSPEMDISLIGDKLVLGLSNIKGISSAITDKIKSLQPFTSVMDFLNRYGNKKEAIRILKAGAARDLPLTSKDDKGQQSLFGDDQLGVEASMALGFDWKNPDEAVLRESCPFLFSNNVWENFHEKVEAKWGIVVHTCDSIYTEIETDTELYLIGSTDPGTFAHKNEIEEAHHKGKPFDTKGKPNQFYDLLNFILDDGTGLVTVRASRQSYQKYKTLIWSLQKDDILFVKAKARPGVNTVFIQGLKVINEFKN
jgi:DNA polymerase-3 subunit alpha